MGVLRWLPSALLLVPWLVGPSAPPDDARLREIAGKSAFRMLDWETLHIVERMPRLLDALLGSAADAPAGADTLADYLRRPAPRPGDVRLSAETALEHLVARAYAQAGVTRSQPLPIGRLFPPVLVSLTPPPNVLVISPRTELRVVDSAVVRAIDTQAQERLEASAESTGVSSLVAPIGGLATYPSMVLDEDPPERILTSVAHEWMHQYLIFYPLGVSYWKSQEAREINETTADLVGQEVGAALARELGLPPATPLGGRDAAAARASGRPTFDFRAFMRETRLVTEQRLQQGDVAGAEAYMRSRRDELQQHGYVIRKLNQAYFALYGSYGDGFAASPANPIPALLRRLRERSDSLADFIFRVRAITTVAELRHAAS